MYFCPECNRYGMEWDGRAKVIMCIYNNCRHVIFMNKEYNHSVPTELEIKLAIQKEQKMDLTLEADIKETLRAILAFADADEKYAEYVQLQSWLEQLINRNKK